MKQKWLIIPVLILVLAIQIGFATQKEGYHMDEILSYELANSEFSPWITPTQPMGRLEKFYLGEIKGSSFGETVSNLVSNVSDILKNRRGAKVFGYTADVYSEPIWMSGEQMHAYVSYDRGDSVPILSAYYNSSTDVHPPLYIMTLNLVSFFARDYFGTATGILINLIFFAGICILLRNILAKVYDRPMAGLIAILFYGLSTAGAVSTLWIRMYTMLSFFCLFALYLCLLKWKETAEKRTGFTGKNKLLIAVIVLGFLTQYFFCIYMFFLALAVGIGLLIRKETAQFRGFVRSILISAVIGLLLYPISVVNVLFSDRGQEAREQAMVGLSGMGIRIRAFASILLQEVLGVKTEASWFIRILTVCCALITLAVIAVRWFRGRKAKSIYDRPLITIPVVVFVGYFLVVARVSPYLIDRYLMPAMPLGVVLFLIALSGPEKETSGGWKKNFITLIGVLLLTIPSLILTKPPYLYSGYGQQLEIAEDYAEEDCLCVYDGYGYYRNVPELTRYRNCLLVREGEILSRTQDDYLQRDQSIMVICGAGVDADQVVSYLREEYGFLSCKELLEEGVNGDRIYRLEKTH